MRGLRPWGVLLLALCATGCLDFSEERFCGEASPYRELCHLEVLAFAEGSPTSGPLGGGTRVLLRGTGFEEGVSVRVGGRAARVVAVRSARELEVEVPAAEATGPATVTVHRGTQQATLATPFTYWALPEVTSVVPESALEGSQVVVLGSGFEPGLTEVYFGERQAEVQVVDARTAIATVPDNGHLAERVPVRAEREQHPGPSGPTFTYGGWRRASLPGGILRAVAWGADGTTYVGGHQALFRRLPGEQQWRESSAGLPPDTGVRALAVPATPAQRVYAATNHGLFRSDNAGLSWWPVNEEVDLLQLLVTGDSLFGRTEGEVLRSTDEGLTWQSVHQGTPADIALAALSPTLLLIADSGAETGGVWTWREVGGAQRSVSGRSTQVAVDASNPAIAYADVAGVLQHSSNAGRDWAPLGLPLSGPTCLAVSGTGDVYACPAGEQLQRVDPRAPTPAWETLLVEVPATGLTFSPEGKGLLTAVGPGLLEAQDTRGDTWQSAHVSLAAAWAEAVVVDPVDPLITFALVRGGGLFRTTDGEEWSVVKSGVDLRHVERLQLTRGAAGQRTLLTLTGTHVLRSFDEGSSWEATARAEGGFANDLLLAVPETGALYVATRQRLHRLPPDSTTWQLLYEAPASTGEELRDLAVRAEGSQEYVFLASTQAVRTRPLNLDWQVMLPLEGREQSPVVAVGVDQSRPYVVVGAEQGLHRATGLDALSEVTQEFGGSFLRMRAQGVHVLAATTRPGELLRSLDAGRTWSRFFAGLPAAQVRDLAFNGAQPQRAYATTTSGLFVTDAAWR